MMTCLPASIRPRLPSFYIVLAKTDSLVFFRAPVVGLLFFSAPQVVCVPSFRVGPDVLVQLPVGVPGGD